MGPLHGWHLSIFGVSLAAPSFLVMGLTQLQAKEAKKRWRTALPPKHKNEKQHMQK